MTEPASQSRGACSGSDPNERTRFFDLYDEASKTIRRTMIVMITFGFFCVLTLGASDAELVSNASTLKIPFADANITYFTFSWIGPLTLGALAAYLHIHLGYLAWMEKEHPDALQIQRQSLPYIFNMERPVLAGIVADIAFYLLVPATLAYFCYRLQFRPEVQLVLQGFSSLTAVALFVVCLKRARSATPEQRAASPWYWRFKKLAVPAGIALAGALAIWVPSRTLHLEGSETLRGDLLRHLDLSGAALSHADLEASTLEDIDLSGADLRGARLRRSALRNVVLNRADLGGADLRETTGLECPILEAARHWQSAHRSPELACGAGIPEAP